MDHYICMSFLNNKDYHFIKIYGIYYTEDDADKHAEIFKVKNNVTVYVGKTNTWLPIALDNNVNYSLKKVTSNKIYDGIINKLYEDLENDFVKNEIDMKNRILQTKDNQLKLDTEDSIIKLKKNANNI